MKISAKSGRRWRLADRQRAGSGSLPNHRSAAVTKAIACKQAPSPTSTTKFLIANLELEFRVTRSKQRTEAKSNRKKIAISETDFSVVRTSSPFSNRNCRSDQDRHPKRPSAVEGTQLRQYGNSARGRSDQISNRNSRLTGFKSTCSKHTIKQNSNRNKNDVFALSASPARDRFLSASLPPRLAATRLTRYNSGSHIEVNQP